MTMPGITQPGQISGQQLGNALFQFLPAMPGEGPPLMPRALAKALFPQGFAPGFPAAPPMAPVTLIPPAAPAAPPVVLAPTVDARGNHIERTQLPAPPAPRKRVLERGSFPAWH